MIFFQEPVRYYSPVSHDEIYEGQLKIPKKIYQIFSSQKYYSYKRATFVLKVFKERRCGGQTN